MGRTRTSRALIGFTVIAIVLGTVAYFVNNKRTKANAQSNNQQADPAPAPKSNNKPTTRPAVGDIAATTKPTQLALLTTTTPPLITNQPAGATKTNTPTPSGKEAARIQIIPVPTQGKTLADAKNFFDAGQFLQARNTLNNLLLSNKLSPADQQAAKELIGKANDTLIFSPRRFSDDPLSGTYTVQAGDRPAKIASQSEVTWDFLGRINNISDSRRLRAGASIKVVKGPFHAVVSKSNFTLDLYLGSPGEAGSTFIKQFKIGHGKNNTTPTGSWMVTPQNKLKNPKWWGTAEEPAKEADDPQNPLGEYWIGLTGTSGEAEGKQGFGIHGTIEPDTIGKQASHGCVRLLPTDIERLYEMLIEGKSTVIIKD
jgi:lipoprotein-anchoring transpeptidase ErfK/SrfK